MSESRSALQARFQQALDTFTSKVKQDNYIIAAILAGSMAYDQVWEKSDIDILLVGRSEKVPERFYYLIEEGVNIHAWLLSRSKFKQQIERALQSSFFHSYFSKSTLLFSTDETISEYYQNVQRLGARDRQLQLLRAASDVLPVLAKAEKWLYVKNDPAYSCLWLMYMVGNLASIEVIAAGEVTSREVIRQALKYNPAFFQAIYFDMITHPVDGAAVDRALRLVNNYLNERIVMLFQPLLDYLSAADGPRSASEIDSYFGKQLQTDTIGTAYEWLADQGVIQKVSHPLRLTEKSRVTVDEASYYYDDERLMTKDER
jgi:predicted nucleotidyltransferase